jgi:hypothetical protein
LKKFSVQRDQAAEQPLVERIENDLVVMEHARNEEGGARNEEGEARNEERGMRNEEGANPQAAVPPQREEPNQHIIDDEDFVISV